MGNTIYQQKDLSGIRGVLFDMDGLVLDTEKLYSRFWMEACHYFGFPMTLEQSLRMRAANTNLGKANLQEFFGPEADYTAIRAKRIELMDAFIAENGVDLKPGIRELLDFLQERGIATAIASSSPMDRIYKYLSAHDLYHRFDHLCSGYDIPHGKPAPDIYLKAASLSGLDPDECLALEDAPLGIESAFRAGCLPVMIPDQDQPDAKTVAMLFAKADSLLDIITLLK